MLRWHLCCDTQELFTRVAQTQPGMAWECSSAGLAEVHRKCPSGPIAWPAEAASGRLTKLLPEGHPRDPAEHPEVLAAQPLKSPVLVGACACALARPHNERQQAALQAEWPHMHTHERRARSHMSSSVERSAHRRFLLQARQLLQSSSQDPSGEAERGPNVLC